MSVVAKLSEFITEELEWGGRPEPLSASSPLLASVDSMSVLTLISFVEEEFEIDVRQEDLTPDNFETIGAVARMIERKRGGA